MQWFKDVPPIAKALVVGVVVVAVGIGAVMGITTTNDWLVVSYGQEMSGKIWGAIGCFFLVTGLAWLWQVIE